MKNLTASDHIIRVLKGENRPMYLHEIREACVEYFSAWHSEAAISARIRDTVRPRLAKEGIKLVGCAPKGRHAWQYRLVYTDIALSA